MLQTTDPQVITTQIDSLHTQVQIIDTTVTHVHVYDTIVTHVYDTIQPDLIAVYDKMFTAQDNNFDNILILITVIVTVLVFAITLFNFIIAKKLFRLEFKKMLKAERENIKKAALEDVEKELYGVKAEHARSMAFVFKNKKNIPMEFTWWSQSLKYASKTNADQLKKRPVKAILRSLKYCEGTIPEFWAEIRKSGTKFKSIEKNMECIPPILTEREEILQLFEKFKKGCPESMKKK